MFVRLVQNRQVFVEDPVDNFLSSFICWLDRVPTSGVSVEVSAYETVGRCRDLTRLELYVLAGAMRWWCIYIAEHDPAVVTQLDIEC